MPFEDLEGHLAAADIVISSTSAPHYVITRERVERAFKHRRHRPMFLIDIAVPRDLDPEINRVRNAYLYDIDDLQHVVEQNRHEREKEAQHAERIVEQELASVNDWLRSLEVVPTIATLREAVEDIRRGELERLSNRLSDLTDEQRAQVDMLTTSIVNKILHVPTVQDEGGRRAATSATCTWTRCARCSTSTPKGEEPAGRERVRRAAAAPPARRRREPRPPDGRRSRRRRRRPGRPPREQPPCRHRAAAPGRSDA